ncbi:ubiquitin C-terminal hydrolase [Cryptosporidium ubiquitum]|uniref:Ubiquitin carboxyl-terminal hydrolase n=1 Tax=Cryptosporidium ubiquitum TaxID=857276 RepID=A0A1J4MK02_9CRYT|nr:ubiquitin C-terminal hydrolase [Cryptosporidium ubiquitum]OII74561.1 ubiquitin C-terminal hydrolase [Cryptosporidium ubiquitum]
MSGDWCTIESDPGVFTELVERYGVKGVQFAEIYDYSESGMDLIISEYGNVYGIIFLFKFTEKFKGNHFSQPTEAPPEMFYANQVINNACATQAILSIILNRLDIDIGSHLQEFKKFSSSFDPMTKGLVIGNSEVLRTAHNSFRPISSLEVSDPEPNDSKGDAFHYICYIPFGRNVYELDGLATGVVNLGSPKNVDSENLSLDNEISALYDKPNLWISRVMEEVKRRIELQNEDSSKDEIRFSLLAVVPDKISVIEKKIKSLKISRQAHVAKLLSLGGDLNDDLQNFSEEEIEPDEFESLLSSIPNNIVLIQAEITRINQEISEGLLIIQNENYTREIWKKENERRRHDFLPFVLTLLKHASKKGLLMKKLSQLQ